MDLLGLTREDLTVACGVYRSGPGWRPTVSGRFVAACRIPTLRSRAPLLSLRPESPTSAAHLLGMTIPIKNPYALANLVAGAVQAGMPPASGNRPGPSPPGAPEPAPVPPISAERQARSSTPSGRYKESEVRHESRLQPPVPDESRRATSRPARRTSRSEGLLDFQGRLYSNPR